ncbi:MAG: tetraacyldisaccharide 4'-kinase [Desulfatiglandaceae bacterium]|jgi:tetraacyldisaccharide 4'-kinase
MAFLLSRVLRKIKQQLMQKWGYNWSRIHRDDEGGLFRCFLKALSAFYSCGVRMRLWGYRHGFLKKKTLPVFVVSIGNISSGGTGKTPAVQMLARWALDRGHRPAVLSRGYGGHFEGRVLEVSDGREIKSSPEKSGDEPYLLARSLTGVPVIVSKNRFDAGMWVIKKLSSDFLILDDGFQHLELERDLNIVLLDATNPIGNGCLLPRGPLREPIEQLERADCCILTHNRRSSGELSSGRLTTARFPGVPIFRSDHVAVKVVFPESGDRFEAGMLEGKRIVAFAGIAHPEYFRETLENLGAEIVYFKAFGDHHRYEFEEIHALLIKRETLKAHYAVTTAKDWVKIHAARPGESAIGYLDIEFALLDGEEGFFELVRERFNDFAKGRQIGNERWTWMIR